MIHRLAAVAAVLAVAGPAAAQDPAAFADLVARLRASASAQQVEAMRRFAARADAPAAIPALLELIRTEAPALDNNGCLALEQILGAHPDAACPLEPLLQVIRRPIWTSRQKGAQALALALRPETVAGQEERIARAVIPLLASQRSRVFAAGARCLDRLAGRAIGDDPLAARAWFFERFGKGIDLLAGVQEIVLVIRPLRGGGFDVQGQRAPDPGALTAAVRAARERAARNGLEIGAVVQVPDEVMQRIAAAGDVGAQRETVAAIVAAGVAAVTVSPASDVFRPPFAERDDDIAALRQRLQAALDVRRGDGVPGATAGIVLADGRCLALGSGVADRAAAAPMPADARMLAGSTGKTLFAALALQLRREGRLDLDARAADWLGAEDWFARVPNAAGITVRMLMGHRSGVMRYELSRGFLRALAARPDHLFTPAEEVAFVLDRQPRFAAGEGFDYSDTNYVLLGMILERIAGRSCYDEIQRRFLGPLGLRDTVPSVGRRLPGLVQGYAGEGNPFGQRDAMLVDGQLPFDAGFEGAGGGFASTASDLARWAKALYEGEVLDGAGVDVLDGEPAPPLGQGVRYGLGAMIDDSELGARVGHSGLFPGYMSAMRYFPRPKVAVAVMVNTSANARLSRELTAWVTELAQIAAGE